MDQLTKLKLLLGMDAADTSQDGLLNLLLEDVAADLLTWTNRDALPVGLESVQRQIVVIRYNMRGAEGQTSHSAGGISRSYDVLPADVKQTIASFRLLKAVRYAATTTG